MVVENVHSRQLPSCISWLGGTLIVVTETFFPVSQERAAVIVHDGPPGVEVQQLVEEVAEVVVAKEEVEVVQDEETEAELSGAAELTELADVADVEAAVQEFVFQDCEAGHQPGPGPGPGPGPSLGPFCSDILSWLFCRTLVTRLGVFGWSRNPAASWSDLSGWVNYSSRLFGELRSPCVAGV